MSHEVPLCMMNHIPPPVKGPNFPPVAGFQCLGVFLTQNFDCPTEILDSIRSLNQTYLEYYLPRFREMRGIFDWFNTKHETYPQFIQDKTYKVMRLNQLYSEVNLAWNDLDTAMRQLVPQVYLDAYMAWLEGLE